MKLIAMIAIALLGFASCKKEDLKPGTTKILKPNISPDRLPADRDNKPIYP